MANEHPEEFIQVAVPRRLYPRVLRVLADAMNAPADAGDADHGTHSTSKRNGPWRADEIRQLKPLIASIPAAFTMMEMTCAKPGLRVGFTDVKKQAGRNHGAARADLATLTRIASHRFGRSTWPVHVEKVEGLLMYDASPEVAEAWNSAE